MYAYIMMATKALYGLLVCSRSHCGLGSNLYIPLGQLLSDTALIRYLI